METRIGTLNFERGYPTDETTRKLFDEMDYQRAVQAYLWAYPAVSFESIRIATKQDLGADYNDLVIADKFVDPKSIWLTANDTTIYAFANIDLGKAGPGRRRSPARGHRGSDRRLLAALGHRRRPARPARRQGRQVSAPAARLQGRGSRRPATTSGRATMNNYNIMVRGIVTNLDKDVPNAVQRIRKMRIYPWSERNSPKPNKFVSMSGKAIDTLPPEGIEFWARLSAFINNNPVQERDRFFMAMLKPLGIEKGKPFKPDARQRAILEDAARIGDAMGRTMLFDAEQRFSGATAISPARNWNWVLLVNPDQETDTYSQLDERLHYTYGAIYTSPGIGVMKAGPGSNYVQAFKDKDGNRLDGGKSYRLRVPPNVPAAAFWSLTLYDTAIRSMIQNPSNDSARSSYDKLKSERGRLGRPLLRAESARGPGEQLDRDGSRQGLLPDVPLLQPQGRVVRRDVEAAGRRVGEMNCGLRSQAPTVRPATCATVWL